jgi:hypothetical protein
VERSEGQVKKTLEDPLPAARQIREGTALDSGSDTDGKYTLPTDIPNVICVQLDVSDVRHLDDLIATPAEFKREVKAVEREIMAEMKG